MEARQQNAVMVGQAVTIAQQFPDTKLANRIAILLVLVKIM